MTTEEQKADIAEKLWQVGNIVTGYGTIQSVALLFVLLKHDEAAKIQHAAPVVVLGVVLIGVLLGTAIAIVGAHERRLRAELGGDVTVIDTVRALVFGRVVIVAVAHVVVVTSVLLHARYGGAVGAH